MKSFLNLKTVFTDLNQRNIQYLEQVYNDDDYLSLIVHELIEDHLNAKNITNKHVLLKPNWVNHDRNPDDEICLRTHNNLIIAVVKVILVYKPSRITIGDAPIQGCNWEKMCPASFKNEINKLSKDHQTPIIIHDFRRVTFNSKDNIIVKERNSISDYIVFDLGKKSFLEPICSENRKQFRVSHYDHERLAEMHHLGVHKYCISKTLFGADVVISMPKVKTHQKAGITAALKNLVGVNGDKDYLPHHRIGGTNKGGDSYPGNNIIRNFSERVLDISNKNIGKPSFRIWQKIAIELWNLSKPRNVDQMGAGWYGNDTTWRMVLDLNRIAIYGKLDGTIADQPQREMYSLCDAIIGGQGDGPLFPKPLSLGFLSFTNNAALNDYIFAYLMNFEPEKFSLIENAFQLYERNFDNIFLNDIAIHIEDLREYTLNTLAPSGWIDFLKAKS